MPVTHVATLIRDPVPDGSVQASFPSADLFRCAFRAAVRDPARGGSSERLVFGGRIVCAQDDASGLFNPRCALSPDGTRFATAHHALIQPEPGAPAEPWYDIRLNGESAYKVPFDTLADLVWLDDQRLAWRCWDRDGLLQEEARCPECSAPQPPRGFRAGYRSPHVPRPRGIRTFVNGADMTGSVDFEAVWLDWMVGAVRVAEAGQAYLVYEDGSRSRTVPMPAGGRFDDALAAVAEERRFDVTGSEPTSRRALGDGNRIGTVVLRSGRFAAAVSAFVGRALDRAERPDAQGKPRAKLPLWAWPLAAVFNPYVGPGYFALEWAKRFVPTVDGVPWTHVHQDVAPSFFFTPDGRFVVTGRTRGGWTVAVDDEEGPVWDEVIRVRFFPGEGLVYLARRGRECFRVTVACS